MVSPRTDLPVAMDLEISIYLEVLLNAFYEAIGCLGLTGHA
jgi:hypothetical protein